LVKETMDKKYNESWVVVIGQGFAFEVRHHLLAIATLPSPPPPSPRPVLASSLPTAAVPTSLPTTALPSATLPAALATAALSATTPPVG